MGERKANNCSAMFIKYLPSLFFSQNRKEKLLLVEREKETKQSTNPGLRLF